MCLTLDFKSQYAAKKAERNPKIAKKDVIVYKSFKRRQIGRRYKYYSPYYNIVEWQMNMHYYRTKDKVARDACHHDKMEAKILGTNIFKNAFQRWQMAIHQGFHSCLTKEQTESKNGNTVVRMIIPKGSKYYTDGKDVVSDNIIFPRQITKLKKGYTNY